MAKITGKDVKNIVIDEFKKLHGFAPKRSEITEVTIWDDTVKVTIGDKEYGFIYEVKTDISKFHLITTHGENPAE